jgi:hypothetical protein
MNEYSVRKARWIEPNGDPVDGWFVIDRLPDGSGREVVAKIFGGDGGTEFKKRLVAVGAFEQ